MDTDSLPALLKEWKEDSLKETDETLMLLEEIKRIENRQRQMIELSSDLEDAYHQLLKQVK
jgi:hypothetical protein